MLGLARALAVCPAAGRGGGDRRGPAAWGWRGRACRDAGRGVRVHGDGASPVTRRHVALGDGPQELVHWVPGARGVRTGGRCLVRPPLSWGCVTLCGARSGPGPGGEGGARPARGALSGSAAPPRRGVRDLAEVLGIACSRGSPGAAGPRTWPARGARLAHSRALPTPPLHLSVTSAAPNKRAGGGTAYTPLRW